MATRGSRRSRPTDLSSHTFRSTLAAALNAAALPNLDVSMKTRYQIQLGVVGVLALIASAIWHGSDNPDEVPATPPTRPAQFANSPSSLDAKSPEPVLAPARSAPVETPSSGSEISATAGGVTFRADASGKIVKDEAARLNLEKLYALSSPAEVEQKLEELRHTLPPTAAEDLTELATQYLNYRTAAQSAFPPGVAPATAEDALNEVDGQHTLRTQYFGAQTAAAFYGSEEKVQRELLRLMDLEKDQSLTMEEKADRAQQLYNELPETSKLGDHALREAAENAGKKD
jgi:hypothetical protein